MACYDVEDTTNDQVYYPERWGPSAKHLRAIDSSWPLTLRKFRAATGGSTFFLTGYRNGANVACGADVDGWHLFQQSVRRCGLDGRKMRDILRKYLEPQLEIVTLAATTSSGTRRATRRRSSRTTRTSSSRTCGRPAPSHPSQARGRPRPSRSAVWSGPLERHRRRRP